MTAERPKNEHEFIAYPTGYLFAVVDDRTNADALVRELEEAGVERSAMLRFTGEEGARRIDASGTDHGILARLLRLLEYADDSRLQAEAYEREARAGHCVIGVHAPETDRRDHLRALVKAHGGHTINYYSPAGFTETLDP